MGAPGAVLDGKNVNKYAFVGDYKDLADENVTIEYLTIENFNADQAGGAVNDNGNNGWTEKYDLMRDEQRWCSHDARRRQRRGRQLPDR